MNLIERIYLLMQVELYRHSAEIKLKGSFSGYLHFQYRYTIDNQILLTVIKLSEPNICN